MTPDDVARLYDVPVEMLRPDVLVRISPELVTRLAAGWSLPVQLMATPLQDGTWELVCRTPEPEHTDPAATAWRDPGSGPGI